MLPIEDFLEIMKADGIGNSAIRNARVTLEQLNDYKPLEELEYLDIAKFINHIREKYAYTEGTISLRKAYIKKYFRYHDRDDIYKKLEVRREARHLNPHDILDAEDINYLLEHMNSPMYKAIITFLFESGARINEALGVKLEDITEVNIGFDVTLYADKTRKHNYAYREMYLIECAPYIREWLMMRNSDSPYLFPIRDRSVSEWLKHLREALKFKKPLNPHAFRHGCATRLVRKGMQESLIRAQMGWSGNSNMISVYVHLANTDLKTYQLMQSGEVSDETSMVEIIQPKETAIDRLSQQEQQINELRDMVQMLMKDKLEREPMLDSMAQLHPEYFPEEVQPTPPIIASVDDIKGAGKNFDTDMKDAIKDKSFLHPRDTRQYTT